MIIHDLKDGKAKIFDSKILRASGYLALELFTVKQN